MREIITKLSGIDDKVEKLKIENKRELEQISEAYEKKIEEYRTNTFKDTRREIKEMEEQFDTRIKQMKEDVTLVWGKKISMLKTKYKESEEDIVDEMVNIIISYGNSR